MKIRRVFIDRGFYGVEIPKMMEKRGLQYVMLARKTKRIKKEMKSLLSRGEHVTPYTIIRSKHETADCTLFLSWDKKRRKWSPFVTNIPVSESTRTALGDEYRRRWNIETSFRVKNGFVAKNMQHELSGPLHYLYVCHRDVQLLGVGKYTALSGAEISLLCARNHGR
jgi:hypothetical protein